jgi:acetylornithine deacetylase/succinyl-diaminopimelate desuccinylase-like protein
MHQKNCVGILQDLIRFDTQNPPGNEAALVNYIHEYCEALHIQNDVYLYEGPRANIIIRIGHSTPDNLVVLGHTDVVRAKAEDWKHDPFEAHISEGYLYGRGALDMKYFIAAAMVVMRSLKAQEASLKRGIIFVFTADEETGSAFGLPRLLTEKGIAEELSHKVVLNEGGGFAVFHQNTCHYLFETGQKSVCRLRLTIGEEPDSNPYFHTTAHEATLVRALDRLKKLVVDDEIPRTSRLLSEAFKDDPVDTSHTMDAKLRNLIDTMSQSMITPTIIHGGARNPNLPSHIRATIDLDCRLLPAITKEQFVHKIEAALEGLPIQVQVLSFSQGYEADIERKFIKLLELTLQKHDPAIKGLLPFITPGSNDGKYLKPLGCEILGFAPLHKDETFTTIMPLIHGLDERISLKSIAFCEQVLHDVCVEYLTGDAYLG